MEELRNNKDIQESNEDHQDDNDIIKNDQSDINVGNLSESNGDNDDEESSTRVELNDVDHSDSNNDNSNNAIDLKEANNENDENNKNGSDYNNYDKEQSDSDDNGKNNEFLLEIPTRRKKKTARILDDSDSDNDKEFMERKQTLKETVESTEKDGLIENSDEETELSFRNYKNQINESSENENSMENDKELDDFYGQINTSPVSKLQSKTKSFKKRSNSLSKEQSGKEKKIKKQKPPSERTKISSLISSESEAELSNNEDQRAGVSSAEEEAKQPSTISKVMRKSAKKALDEMQSIQSQQQRLIREMNISIPYHKPKSFTLHEFLQRRSAVPVKISTEKPPMVIEEVESYSKLIKERIQQSVEFFQSESESENETETNLELVDVQEVTESNNNDNIQEKDELASCLSNSEDTENNPNNENINTLTKSPRSSSPNIIDDKSTDATIEKETEKIAEKNKLASKSSLILSLIDSDFKPVLGGDPNKLIDLETGELIDRKPTGIEKLMERAMWSMKKPKKDLITESKTSCNVLKVDNGHMEVVTLNINTNNYEENNDKEIIKPRASYIALKKHLKEVMQNKRVEELKKRKEETEKIKKKCEDLIDDEDKEENDTSKEEIEENEINSENSKELHDDEEEEDFANSEEEENESDLENEQLELPTSDIDANSEIDKNCSLENEEKENCMESLFNFSSCDSKVDDINCLRSEMLEQSEKFQNNSILNKTSAASGEKALLSQIPIVEDKSNVDEDELMALCSGMFGGQESNNVELSKCSENDKETSLLTNDESDNENINDCEIKRKENDTVGLLSTDDESDNDLNECKTKRNKKFTKKNQKHTRKIKLDISDEEDENDNDNAKLQIEEDEEENEDNEDSKTENENMVYYDSEENEIVLTKEEKAKLANKFFEAEAELSGSEIGSSDEDETGLDNYEKEFVDKEEEFDAENLHSELEKIHVRKMIDADIRAVRQLKEFLLPDEETDGVGRQRVFKWKNLENTFTLDDEGNKNDVNNEEISNNNETDEQNENTWRKMRYERERFLKEQNLSNQEKIDIQSNLDVIVKDNSVHKLQNDSLPLRKNDLDKFLITKNLITEGKTPPTRGSFLIRDKETLHKLVGLTNYSNSSNSNMNNINMINISGISKPKNFVFTTLTAEESEAKRKRKAEEELNPSCNESINYIKKPKLQPRREKCIIDLLLEEPLKK